LERNGKKKAPAFYITKNSFQSLKCWKELEAFRVYIPTSQRDFSVAVCSLPPVVRGHACPIAPASSSCFLHFFYFPKTGVDFQGFNLKNF